MILCLTILNSRSAIVADTVAVAEPIIAGASIPHGAKSTAHSFFFKPSFTCCTFPDFSNPPAVEKLFFDNHLFLILLSGIIGGSVLTFRVCVDIYDVSHFLKTLSLLMEIES